MMASIRKRPTQTGEPRFEVRWRDSTGRPRSKTFPRRRDAARYALETERRKRLGPLYEAPPEQLGVFYLGWLERAKRPLSESTFEKALYAGRDLGVPTRPGETASRLAAYYLEEITVALVEDEIAAIARRAPRQAQLALSHLKQALRNARERGQVVDDAIFRIKPPSYDEREPRFLSWPETERLASWCSEPNLIRFDALTGLRQGECFALDETDVDLKAGTVLVRAGTRHGKRQRTKTRRHRTVYLCDEAVQIAREQLLRRRAGTTLLFPTPTGKVWWKDNFMARIFRPAAVRAGLGTVEKLDDGEHYEGIVFHDLRHTCASLMIAAGANPLEVAEQLGHFDKSGRPDPRLIWSRYGHLYPGATRAAARRLDRVIAVARDDAETAGEEAGR